MMLGRKEYMIFNILKMLLSTTKGYFLILTLELS